MKKFYILGIVFVVFIVGFFYFVNGNEETYEEVYAEGNSSEVEEVSVEVEKIKIHVVGEVISPRNL